MCFVRYVQAKKNDMEDREDFSDWSEVDMDQEGEWVSDENF